MGVNRLRHWRTVVLIVVALGLMVFIAPFAFGSQHRNLEWISIRFSCFGVAGEAFVSFSDLDSFQIFARWLEGKVTSRQAVKELDGQGVEPDELEDVANVMLTCDGVRARSRTGVTKTKGE